MNFLFISPNYPSGHRRYVAALRKAGANVLCVGDAGYETFGPELRGNMTEYYRVGDLHDYESVYRACAYYVHKYGRLDRIDSLNPYWRDLDARLREEWRVEGTKPGELSPLLDRALCFTTAGAVVPTAPFEPLRSLKSARLFAEKYGYPLVLRSICDKRLPEVFIAGEAQLDACVKGRMRSGYLLCAAPEGETISCDGLTNAQSKIVLASCHAFTEPPEKVEEEHALLSFCGIDKDEALVERCQSVLSAFPLGCGFFSFRFVKLARALNGVAGKGDYLLLSISLSPPAEYLASALGYSYGADVFDLWAGMQFGLETEPAAPCRRSVVGFASRRFDRSFMRPHEKILRRLGARLLAHGLTPEPDRAVYGDYYYVFSGETKTELRRSIRFIQEDYAPGALPATAKPVKKRSAVKKAALTGSRKTESDKKDKDNNADN